MLHYELMYWTNTTNKYESTRNILVVSDESIQAFAEHIPALEYNPLRAELHHMHSTVGGVYIFMVFAGEKHDYIYLRRIPSYPIASIHIALARGQ